MEFAGRPLRHLADLFRIAPAHPRPAPLRDHVRTWVERHADRPAFRQAGMTITYGEWNQRANRYARWARSLELRESDVVGLLLDSGPEALAACVGLAKLGVATALLDGADSIRTIIEAVGSRRMRCLIIHAGLLPKCIARGDLREPALPVYVLGEADCAGARQFRRFDIILAGFSGSEIPQADRVLLTGHETCLLRIDHSTEGPRRLRAHDQIGLMRAVSETADAVRMRRRDSLFLATQSRHAVEGLIAAAAILSRGGVCVVGDSPLRNVWVDARQAGCTVFATSAGLLEPLSLEQIRMSRGLVAGLTPETRKRPRFWARSSALASFPKSCAGEALPVAECHGSSRASALGDHFAAN